VFGNSAITPFLCAAASASHLPSGCSHSWKTWAKTPVTETWHHLLAVHNKWCHVHSTGHFPCRHYQFWSRRRWIYYAGRNGTSDNTTTASIRHGHTWTCDEDGHLVAPDAHCSGILRRHDGFLNKRDVSILLLCPPRATKETLDNIRASDVRKLVEFMLGGSMNSCLEEQVAGALVIQKMDLCGLVQRVTCELTGLYRLMIANWISLHHDVKYSGCKIHCCHCLCPRVHSQGSTREHLWNTYRHYEILLTEIYRTSSFRMV